jgi:putative transposase
LHSFRFVDSSPAQIYATLLDEGRYLCSIRTFYRLLESRGELRERRNQLRHPNYQRPELLATAPNQVWSWDITKLRGPNKGSCYSLYVILDIFSRYVVGWLIAEGERKALAERLINETSTKYSIPPGQLTLHSDRGSCMTAQTGESAREPWATHREARRRVDEAREESLTRVGVHRPDRYRVTLSGRPAAHRRGPNAKE